jgi:predicted transposase/invertase (TIGR01784 family)
MDKKPLSPTNDYVFKRLFTEHISLLSDFLHAVLGLQPEDCQDIQVLDPHLKPESIDEKRSVLDVKVHTKTGSVIDIEVQVKEQDFIWRRVQYYCARLLAEQGKRGGEYEQLPKVISILIAGFPMMEEDGIAHHCFRFYDEKNKVRFQDSMQIDILEIPKVREKDQSRLADWLRFFAAREEEAFTMLAQTNPAMAEAWGVIKRLSADESARMIAESREKALMDFNSAMGSARRKGLQEGEQKGRLEGRLEVARNLLREKLPVEVVAKGTGLSLEEVKQLAAGLMA